MAAALTAVVALVVAAVALAEEETANVGSSCVTKFSGDTLWAPMTLPEVPLPAGYSDYTVEIPSSECGLGVAGIEVTVCEPLGPPGPDVHILALDQVQVHRYSAALPATFHTKVYCRRY